jgi:hypothetical protein
MNPSRLLLRCSLSGAGLALGATLTAATGCGGSHDVPPADAGADVVTNDAGPPPIDPEKPLIPGDLSVRWMTLDDHVVFLDNATDTLSIAPLTAGAAPEQHSTHGADARVTSRGDVVAVWDELTTDRRIGKMSVWSKGTPLTVVGERTTTVPFGANPKSGRVIYPRNVAADGVTADAAFAPTSDPRNAKTILSGIDVSRADKACDPRVSAVADRFVVSYCSAGAARPKLVSVDAAGAVTPLLDDAEILGVATQGGLTVLALEGRDARGIGTLKAISAAGGPAVTIAADVAGASLDPSGANAVYRTGGGALARSTTASPAPSVVVPSGVREILGITNDAAHALVSTAIQAPSNDVGQPLTNVVLVSLASPGATTTLLGTPTGGAGWAQDMYYSDPFTADDTRALFLSDVKVGDDSRAAGTLNIAPVAGGAPRAVASNVVMAMYYGSGSSVVLEQRPDGPTSATELATDVSVVDAAGDAPPTRIASAKEVSYTYAFDRIVYVPRATTVAKGIYVKVLP